jgi:S-adenosylmethionine:tRNA ribosyltransferase-isomerase
MSKLLVYANETISDTHFINIDKYIPSDYLLVFNNTKVIRARILFQKKSGSTIEIFCLEPVNPPDYDKSFNSRGEVVWKCIVGNLKKWKNETLVKSVSYYNGNEYELRAEKIKQSGDSVDIKFSWNPEFTFSDTLESIGRIPLPPYIDRDDMEEDSIRYQTVFASIKGSVAAPTAGLHFSEKVIEKLKNEGVAFSEITLHVGAGTFQPLKSPNVAEHKMHREHFVVTRDTINSLLQKTGKIIAVGTTTVRTLESLYYIGIRIIKNNIKKDSFSISQWEPYEADYEISLESSLNSILEYIKTNRLEQIEASTEIMIIPRYKFRIVNGIITNFHQPGSTLLLLVSAWTGEKWKDIYDYALKNNFRFLSYGDSSLLF